MHEFYLKGYFHGLDLNIIQMDEHQFIIVIVIWDILVKCWKYVDYISFVKQGFQNIPKNIHKEQKAQFECSNIILKILH
jgi:hypothetical protein